MSNAVASRSFWERPAFLAAIIVAVAIPLLLPPVPPLVDLPGHIARYYVELNLDASPYLRRYYDFHWALIGNLGVDLLIIPFAHLFGIELGAKLIVIAIPMMMAAGLLAVARELHGRIPPTALFALPLVYLWPFQFGFVNFALSTAFCFLAFALWLRLGRAGRTGLRAALFVPAASLIWLAHTYGWGLLGVFCFSAETAARRERGLGWPQAVIGGATACIPLMLPFALMLLWRSGAVAGDTGDWNPTLKLNWLVSILREHFQAWDVASAALIWAIVALAALRIDLRLVPTARIALLLLALLFLAMPRVLIGSGFADMRLAPVIAAIGLVGTTNAGGRLERHGGTIAAFAIAFLIARLAVTTVVFADLSRLWQRQLAAAEHIDRGSRVLVLAYSPCLNAWANHRVDHVSSLAVPRREVFTNGQWALAGAQLLQVTYRRGAPFVEDPSHLLRPPGCAEGPAKILRAVDVAPRAFDYLWLVDVPRAYWPSDPRLVPVWQDETGVLYRSPQAPPTAVSRTPTAG